MKMDEVFCPYFKRSLNYVKECVRILDLRVQVHPGELWVSKQRVRIVLEAGAKGDVPKVCAPTAPVLTHSLSCKVLKLKSEFYHSLDARRNFSWMYVSYILM